MNSATLANASIGEYRLVDFLGAGGMGEVYRAVDARTGRVVAIKRLTGATSNAKMVERFRNEATIQARLWHPAIVRLYDFIEAGAQLCIVMEYVDGETLAERLQSAGPLSFAETLLIFRAVVEAIAYLHDESIVHRDIKSNNIKINSKGDVKLLDFGIAKAEGSPQLTATGDVIGTFEYLSPEQLTGQPADARSDIWALGVLLYEMVSGHVPFDATTIGRLIEQISKADYKSASLLNPDVPREIEAIINRCLKRNPAARYASARELLAEIERAAVAGQSAAAPASAFAAISTSAWLRENWQAATVAAATVLTAVVLLLVAINGPQPRRVPPAPTLQPVATPVAPVVPPSDLRAVRVNTFEGPADVFRDGERVGVTPYEITARLGERVRLTLKRAGYQDESLDFAITENKKEYTVTMQRLQASE